MDVTVLKSRGSTTGIQNESATDGLTYACNVAASVPAATAVCFYHPTPIPVELERFSVE